MMYRFFYKIHFFNHSLDFFIFLINFSNPNEIKNPNNATNNNPKTNLLSIYKDIKKLNKNRNESNRDCAIREFEEETNINRSKFNVIDSIDPIEENFIGTNGLKYRNIYYIAELKERTELSVNGNNEINQINFFNYNDSVSIIRDYQTDKKDVLTGVYYYYLELIINTLKPLG